MNGRMCWAAILSTALSTSGGIRPPGILGLFPGDDLRNHLFSSLKTTSCELLIMAHLRDVSSGYFLTSMFPTANDLNPYKKVCRVMTNDYSVLFRFQELPR